MMNVTNFTNFERTDISDREPAHQATFREEWIEDY